MSSYWKILLGVAWLGAACLPAVGTAAIVGPLSSALDARPPIARPFDVRLTGFARPRALETVPGSSSVGLATYAFRPLFLPVDLPALTQPTYARGGRTPLQERNRTWNSGQHSFLRPQRGHHLGYEREDDFDEDLGEHETGHGHGHGHGDGHGGTPVPLPAPWLMLVSGLLALVTARRVSAPQG